MTAHLAKDLDLERNQAPVPRIGCDKAVDVGEGALLRRVILDWRADNTLNS